MLAEILLGAVVVTVFVLIAVDMSKTPSDTPHGHADESAHDVLPAVVGATRGARSEPFFREPAEVPPAAQQPGPGRPSESISPSASALRSPARRAAARDGQSRELKNWHVRSRLLLLVIIPTVAVTVVAFCIVRMVGVAQGASIHSASSAARDKAIVTLVIVGAVVIIVLALASWFTVVVARSVLRPLYRLRAGALEAARLVPPDAVRRIGENNGRGTPSDYKPIGVDSCDEFGEIAHAFDQMRGETSRLAANQAALRGRLNAMFLDLSHRSQSLVERQARLIEHLEQAEQDPERLAYLVKMSRLAARMQRKSQNLLVLAGHELSTGWKQPVALVNVMGAAVSEIEESDRVSLGPQPDLAVRGLAVHDVVHLLAELVENATSFSAADMPVEVSGHLPSTGGVVLNITDHGIGMSATELAYANWQLENPPAVDINVPRWMGLFVVAKLSARHGIRVRLHQAEFGGLTALVWLPDEVTTHQGADGAPRFSGLGSVASAPGLPQAMVDPGYVTSERTAARSAEFVSSQADPQDVPLGRRLAADAGQRPGPAWSPVGARPVSQAGLPVTAQTEPPAAPHARPPVIPLPEPPVTPQAEPRVTPQAEPPVTLPAEPSATRGPSLSGQPDATAVDVGVSGLAAQILGDETALGQVIMPPEESLAKAGGPLIYDEMESHWFRSGRQAPGSPSRIVAAESRWSSPADEGWHAAQTVDTPSSAGSTAAGLPRRLPNANLIPGSITSPQPAAPNRSAAAARDRFAGLQRGTSEGRAAASEAADRGANDES
jgi:signal transduction histidine kinase